VPYQVIKAMAVIQRPRDNALLVSAAAGPGSFHRPLGGHVEFGEYAIDTIHREFEEEIGQRLTGVRLLGVVENIFQWQGATQHEVVFVFRAAFADPAAYEIESQPIRDEPQGGDRVIWRPAGGAEPPLYPDGVAELIDRGLPPRRDAGNCRTGLRPGNAGDDDEHCVTLGRIR
jgi:ADP-ribose pyrophosphatase YjhB (NUDIX family)